MIALTGTMAGERTRPDTHIAWLFIRASLFDLSSPHYSSLSSVVITFRQREELEKPAATILMKWHRSRGWERFINDPLTTLLYIKQTRVHPFPHILRAHYSQPPIPQIMNTQSQQNWIYAIRFRKLTGRSTFRAFAQNYFRRASLK